MLRFKSEKHACLIGCSHLPCTDKATDLHRRCTKDTCFLSCCMLLTYSTAGMCTFRRSGPSSEMVILMIYVSQYTMQHEGAWQQR